MFKTMFCVFKRVHLLFFVFSALCYLYICYEYNKWSVNETVAVAHL